MATRTLVLGIVSLVLAGSVLADEHCDEPVAHWQSRDALRQQLESHGWKVQRIKVDDGCYEVKGVDRIGNRFEAKYTPASLKIRELEIRFDHSGSASDYLDKPAPHAGASNLPVESERPAIPE